MYRKSYFGLVYLLIVLISSRTSYALFDNLRASLTSLSDLANNIGGTTLTATINSISTEEWQKFQERDYCQLTKEQLQTVLNTARSKLDERSVNIIRSCLLDKITPEEVFTELSKATSQADIQKLCEKLAPPTTWVKDTIVRQWNALRKCPSPIICQVTDKEALTEIKNRIGGDRNLRPLYIQIVLKLYGDPSVWTAESIAGVQLDEFILPIVCLKGKSEMIMAKINDVSNVALRCDPETQRNCLNKLLENLQLKSMTDAAMAQNVMNQLRNFRNLLMPGDFNDAVLSNPTIKQTLDQNIRTASTQGILLPDGVHSVMQKFSRYENITKEIVRQEGSCSLAWVQPSTLHRAAVNRAIEIVDLVQIVKCLRSYNGPGANDKIHTLITLARNSTQNLRDLYLSNYEPELLREFDWREWRRINPGDARTILTKPCNFTAGNAACLMERLTSQGDYRSLYQNVREYIPANKIDLMSSNDIILMCKDLLPGSALCMKGAEMYMRNLRTTSSMIEPSDVRNLLQVLPFMTSEYATRFNDAKILLCLREMKDVNPTLNTILTLKNKLQNYTGNISNEFREKTLSFLSNSDFESFPLCFLASFGRELSSLSSPQKKVMLLRLGLLKNIGLSCPRNNRMAIVKEGLRAMRPGIIGIQPGEVDIIGNAIFDVPAEELTSCHENEKYNVITKANDMINERRIRPCLSMEQINAFARILKDVKGSNVAEWKCIRLHCCIIYVLVEEAKNLRPEVGASCNCELRQLSPSEKMEEAICKGSLGERNFNLTKEAEIRFQQSLMLSAMKLATEGNMHPRAITFQQNTTYNNHTNTTYNNRGKRQTSSSTSSNSAICDKAAYGGADAFTREEIDAMDQNVFYSCLRYFCSKDMEQEKAEALATKILKIKNYNMGNTYVEEMEEMKFCLKGFNDRTISQSFPRFTAERFDSFIVMIGQMTCFSEIQTRALGSKIVGEWARPGNQMNSTELLMINQQICGFSLSHLNSINIEAFKGAVSVLSSLKNCPRNDACIGLFLKAKQAYGDISYWNASDVAKIGVIFSGMMPEDWVKIRPQALEGLSPLAVEKFDDDSIRSMNSTHISHMNPAAISAFTDQQKGSFSPQMMRALDEYSRSYEYESFATKDISNPFLIFMISILTNERWNFY